MKIKPEHYAHMRAAILPALASMPTAAQYEADGMSAKRHRWDACYRAKLTPWICDNLYSYVNDTHIDTALRAIVSEAQS